MKDKYEISLWEDYLVEASGDIPAHFKERKLCVIGSNTMTDSFRAFEPQLTSNINGTHTFTFKMYYIIKENEISIETPINDLVLGEDGSFLISENDKIIKTEISTDISSDTGDQVFIIRKNKNPFLSLLVNERKVKVFWKDEWYDFVIKNCQEDSSGKCITYTCTDVFINELSKNGFNIVLDDELENNSGTVLELAQTVLDGTDWVLDTEGSDIVQQKKEEPVYEANALSNLPFFDQTDLQQSVIPAGKKVLVFYQQIQDMLDYFDKNSVNSKIDEIQVAYAKNYERDTNSQLVTNAHCYSATVQWIKEQYDGTDCLTIKSIGDEPVTYLHIFYKSNVSANYRASRLVKHQVNKLDTLTGKYCNVWKVKPGATIPEEYVGLIDQDDEIYEYRATEWNDALVVNNLAVNPKDFITNEGWIGDENLAFQLYPPYSSTEDISAYTAKSYLHLSSGVDFYNDGIHQQSSFIPDGFSVGETYIFRYKARANGTGGPGESYIRKGITPSVCTYKDEGAYKVIDENGPVYFSITDGPDSKEDNWVEYRLTCTKSITRTEIHEKKIGLFLTTNNVECWIEEVQFFKEIFGTNETRINPGDIDVNSVASIKYNYFNHTKTQGLISADDINLLWSSTLDWDCREFLEPQYNEKFEKIRSISAKQSNRFNLIQTLAETFECWAQFIIEHDETGKILYNEDGTPRKFVRFKNEIGQNTGIGFIYGIDLRAISRTIQSDQIVTKTIVSPNNNEFAKQGFCTIARSKENYPRINFILNFDYFISQGLIDGGVFNNDLYDSTSDIGYYYWLNKWNTEYDEITDFLDAKHLELTKQSSYQTVYDGTITALQGSIANLQADLMGLADVQTWEEATAWIKANADQNQVSSKMTALETEKSSLNTYLSMKEKLDLSIAQLQTVIEEKEAQQKQLVKQIEALDLKFYKKYSRFIQEGSWTSEDYIDDDLYYLDAQSVAYTSSRPQISYDISVMRISSIEEFKNKVFHLGDISFIQDPEFFGYVYIKGVKTPYKEKVLISEVTSHFDSPEQDTFKVQNYKTQFEDLFQRITSTTQSLQYASGSYARAAAAIEPTGTINPETLQNSIALNEQLVYSAQNEAIITDSTGVTVSDTTNPNKKTKITSGGLFITTDGGATWKNAVRGEGIATQFLTAGSINTNNISIMDGNFRAFRWDESGINAYYKLSGDTGINLSKFVRFDHFGIYGVNTDSDQPYKPQTEAQIWEDAKFGMTWSGFFIKNKYNNYSVEVSSTDDIRVIDKVDNTIGGGSDTVELIKIGKIYSNPDIFGIRISSVGENTTTGAHFAVPVMETDNTGKLWLRDSLSISTTPGTSNNGIAIGYLPGHKPLYSDIHQVFNANNKFLIYEDGSIAATAGTIGGMTIDQVTQAFYRVECNKDRIYKYYDDEDYDTPVYFPEHITFIVYDPQNQVLTPKNVRLENPSGDYAQDFEVVGQDTTISNIVALLKRVEGEVISDSGEYPTFVRNLLNEIYSVDTTEKTVTFDFTKLFDYNVAFIDPHEEKEKWPSHENTNSEADRDAYCTLTKILAEETVDLKIIISGEDFSLTKLIPISFNVSGSMAKFELTASDIAMLVGDSTLTFNEGGLEIRKGGFTIYDDTENPQPVFFYDLVNHHLSITGNAEFTGVIHATAGDFKGDVTANKLTAISGDIGGFYIQSDGLYSKKGANDSSDVSGSLIKLLGESGEIYAENITLGKGARISERIQLGNANLWNPDFQDANGLLLNAGAFSLTQSGVMKVGDIEINGLTSTITGKSYAITPDLATFSNVNISGKITTSVFEKGHIQSVGSSIMFNPSYKIESSTGTVVTLGQEYSGIVGNYVYVTKQDGSLVNAIVTAISENKKEVTLNSNVGYGDLVSLIDIGANGGLIIGVNSSDSATSFLKPRGITISEFNADSTSVNPKVFLGDLEKSQIVSDASLVGFGLYSENVYLMGALTTKFDSNSNVAKYAGINTLNGAEANKFGQDDTSKIVFWAGSAGTAKEAVKDAPFQVTEKGSIYATRAKFQDSIITNSTITGAEIRTARIYGTGSTENNGYGLSFYDATNGIAFFTGIQVSNFEEVFSIGTNGLKRGNNPFIDILTNAVNFSGDIFKGTDFYTNKAQGSYIRIHENTITSAHIDENSYAEVPDTKIIFNDDGIKLQTLKANKKIDIDASNVQINNTIYFGTRMRYEQLANGYNLFVLP